jgi:DNA-binding NtrC family response regulator
MEILILDDLKSRLETISQSLEKRRYKVISCRTSNDFLTSINQSMPGLILMDYDTWFKGRSIWFYFQIGEKLQSVPIIFYNTPPKFVAVKDRKRHEKDYVLQKPSEVDSIIDAVSHTS